MKRVTIPADSSGFQEDKDLAKQIRADEILPALEGTGTLVIDFSHVTYATQSFVHALIGEALKRHGEDVLDRIEFYGCSSQLRSIIELVVNYSLGGFAGDEWPEELPIPASKDRGKPVG